MTSGPPWVYYIVAGVLSLLGMWLLYWSMWRDRARGRRRCPKCWYDMTGSPSLTCSECGHVAKRERKLRKTRRHWRIAVLAILTLLLALSLALAPKVHRDRWLSIVPTTALILALPWTLDSPAGSN